MTAAEFGTLVIEEGHRGRQALVERYPDMREHLGHEAAACYDLREADAVKRAVDTFARSLAAQDGSKEVLENLRGPGDAGTVMNYVRDVFEQRPYVDLYDLAARAERCAELTDEVRAAAADVCTAVDALVIASFGMHGLKGFEAGRHGIFIAFPDGDAQAQGALGAHTVWSQLRWYTPLGAGDGREDYGRWSFLADGATPDNGRVENWFELLDSWFDETAEDPGGHNRYVP